MPVKIQKRLQALSALKNGDVRDDFKKEIKKSFGDELLDLVRKGVNPVKKTGNKYQQYSESYKEAIKAGRVPGKTAISPVTLKQTGKLYESLTIDISGDNPRVTFTDEKAFYHNNEGVGKSKVKRRLLPDGSGEEFTIRLFQKILEALKNSIKKNLL
jgi:hypothetical protein